MAYSPRKINAFWLVLLTLLMVIASIFIFVQLIESTVGGPIQWRNLWQSSEKSPRIAILKSDFTAEVHDILRFNGSGKAWRDSTVSKWQQLLRPRNIDPYPFTDEDIENGKLFDGNGERTQDILILPSVRAMSDLEMQRLSEFLKKGGNILGSWALGIYRPNGEWRGWDFIENNFGVKFKGFVEQSTGSHQIKQKTFAGGAMKRGLYLPKDKIDLNLYQTVIDASEGALEGYAWVAEKPLAPISSDYALVDTTHQSNLRNAVQVTFYQWIGGNPDAPQFAPTLHEAVRNFTLRSQTPLTADIPAGYRMRVGTYDRPIMVAPTHVRTQMAGFWYDHTIEDKPLPDAAFNSAGLVYGTQGEGRFVYIGHELIAMGAKDDKRLGLDPEDQQNLDHFFTNALNWLHHQPVASVGNFPFGYEAAASVMVGTNQDFSTLTEYGRIFQQENVAASYFLTPDLMKGNENWIKTLSKQGDVGIWIDRIQQAQEGNALLNQMLSEQAQQKLGFWYNGTANLTTENYHTLQNTGFRYQIRPHLDRASMPKVLNTPFTNIVQIPKSGRSAEDAYLQGARDVSGLQAVFLQDAERTQLEGGVYPILLENKELASTQIAESIQNTIQQLKKKRFWLPSASVLAHWIQGRAGIRITSRKTSPERTVIHLSNDSDVTLDSVALYVYLEKAFNPNTQTISIRPETVQMKNIWHYLTGEQKMIAIPNQDFQFMDQGRTVLRLKIRNLSARQDVAYQIDVITKRSQRARSWWRFWE